MTDMRATERLLEVICEEADAVYAAMAGRVLREGFTPEDAVNSALGAIVFAVTELRRRGDTLVRANDLRNAMAIVDAQARTWGVGPDLLAVIDRLNNALAGVL